MVRLIGGAAIKGLDWLKDLVAAHPDVGPAGVGDVGRLVVAPQHLLAGGGTGHLQAPAEADVVLALAADDTGRVLGQQDDVDAHGAARAEERIHFGGKVGELGLELGVLVDDHKEVGQRLRSLSGTVLLQIIPDIGDTCAVEESLAPLQLALQGDEVAADIGIKVRDGTHQMGQVHKRQN